jgi:hypothetical protein
MEGIHRRTLQKEFKHFYRVPGKRIHTGTIGDEN